MCAIAGLIEPGSPNKEGKVRRMIRLMAHRGPDDEGLYVDEDLCLGHRRLAIIDLSPKAHQPMVADGAVLVFNGEIYNYKQLKKELADQGHLFHSTSDSEVLLRGYLFWGYEVLNRLRGMFAFALWDRTNRRLFCARDPFGKKPFYYAWHRGRHFIFASEVEAVVSALPGRPGFSLPKLAHYLLKGYFPPGQSVYDAIHCLQPGHYLEIDFQQGKCSERPYWQGRFTMCDSFAPPRAKVYDQLEEHLHVAVRRRFESDVPVGVLLSGGVDSSLVALISAEEQPSRINTFTVTFPNTSFNEAAFARQAARLAGSLHTEFAVTMSSLPMLLPRLVRTYGEPFGDYSAIPTFRLFAGLQPYCKVVLTGDGGDEVFAGYRDGKLFWWRQLLRPCWGLGNIFNHDFLERAIYLPIKRLRELGYLLTALRRHGADAFQSLSSVGWTTYWRKALMRPEAWQAAGEDLVERRDRQLFEDAGRHDLERFLNRFLERLTQAYLVKVDRASMAHSIEARSPFLDIDLFDQVRQLPASVLLRRGEPKSLLKDLLAKKMGSTFARRTKMGFTPPLQDWFRAPESAAWLEKHLTDKESLAYALISPEKVRHLITLHRRGHNHTGRLWYLLFLNEWHNLFFRNLRPEFHSST